MADINDIKKLSPQQRMQLLQQGAMQPDSDLQQAYIDLAKQKLVNPGFGMNSLNPFQQAQDTPEMKMKALENIVNGNVGSMPVKPQIPAGEDYRQKLNTILNKKQIGNQSDKTEYQRMMESQGLTDKEIEDMSREFDEE